MSDQWESFAAATLPPDAPPEQHREMRRAFYGGAWTVLMGVEIAAETRTDEEERAAVSLLELWKADCTEFARDVSEGRA